MKKIIIFDWDDVFTLGSKEGYFACYHKALQDVGVELKPEEERKRILNKWGRSHREELAELLKENIDLLEDACKVYEKNMIGDTFVENLSLVSGAQNFLQEVAKEYTLCIATGADPNMLKDRIMPKFSVPQVFSQIITAKDIQDPSKMKPHPYSINKILQDQGFSSEEAFFVGDARGDVLMAQAAHVDPVVVLTGHLSEKDARNLGVKYIIEDVTQLKSILAKQI